jgi:N-acetylneuraminate synthase
MNASLFRIGEIAVGENELPLVVPEVGINHGGSVDRALELVRSAAKAGARIVKFQTHIVEEEMVHTDLRPGPISDEPVWDIISRCSLSESEEQRVFAEVRELGMEFLSTPFSIAAVDRLEKLGVVAYKIGSGEVSNPELISHVAGTGKPVIMSTGMHSQHDVSNAVSILDRAEVPVALLHCISLYPTPYEQVNLHTILRLRSEYPEIPIGFSDHSKGIWTSIAAISLGATIVEKHFTISRSWPGPDMPVSIEPDELQELIAATEAVWKSRGGRFEPLAEEHAIREFAVASAVLTINKDAGDTLQESDIRLMRPGTGDFHAETVQEIIGKRLKVSLPDRTILMRGHFN